ncbi:TadE family protein [Oceanimonas sp. GK1]|uniref:TadE/TadG family type IV pilus assembly protein n=1 Tax=Oceanimonas sp. (strain GK1 / IBRC-M 10197) TaxID=511062 RepID=UPI00024954F0|nr:TadE family protein [Oceanimonas sp. GK1]AEY01553.1 TadE family protein [Oceanimonas sp. GK1]
MRVIQVSKSGKSKQQGLAVVEFAIVGSVVFLVLFAVMELGRLLYTWSVLNEVTRQAARVATVCSPDESVSVADSVASRLGGGVPGLTGSNVNIEYLTDGFIPVSGTELPHYVRAGIVNYRFEMILPLSVDLSMFSPNFSTVVRAESLGETPDGVIDCF